MPNKTLSKKINLYVGALIITLVGAGASMLIIHIAYTPSVPAVIVPANVNAIQLQRSLLAK